MRTIIVGVDGSDASLHAARWAVGQAALDHADIRLLHAYGSAEAAHMIGAPIGTGADRDALAREHAMTMLAEAREHLESGDEHVTSEAAGGPAAAVLVEASTDADLLVLGSRGRGGFAGLLLGSVSQQCAAHSRCPVVIVPRDR